MCGNKRGFLNDFIFYLQLHTHEYASEWRKLDPEEKAKYQALYEADKKAYERAIIEWEAEMIRDRKEHLVSASMLSKDQKKNPSTQTSPKTASKTPTAVVPNHPSIDQEFAESNSSDKISSRS